MKLKNACFALAVLFSGSMVHAQVTGSGTTDFVPLWTGTKSLGNSAIFQKGTDVGIGTKKPGAKLEIDIGLTSGNAVTAHATSKVSGATGIGVYGQADGSNGVAIFGHATTLAGNTSSGVAGQVDSNGGASGVYGHGAATTGTANGVFGQTDAPSGAGVFGIATSTTGGTGGVFVSSAPANPAVFGLARATTGVGGAIVAENDSNDPGGGSALTGISETTTGTVQGIFASTASPNAVVALFRALANGNIIIGQAGTDGTNVFRVDGTGKGFFDGGTQTGGADFAEAVAIAKESTQHEPGDLLIVDTTAKRQLKLSSEPYSTLVAGIYSTKPGVLATPRKMVETAANEIPLAIVGIVPCKVSAENGAIQPGDLLVASSTPGHAMKGTDRSRMLGAVVGKALEPLNEGKGVIQVLVTLQ